jgi:flagellar basal-body rod modification protein FlgD
MAIDFNTLNGTTNNSTIKYTTDEEQTKLTNDDFLKMFLAELKYQDPLEPTDAAKMLDSTMQMSTIESNESQSRSLSDIANSLGQSGNLDFVNVIGKKIVTENTTVSLSNGKGNFEYYTDTDIEQGSLYILDANGNKIGELDISDTKEGINNANFNDSLYEGFKGLSGDFSLSFSALDENNKKINIYPGEFKVVGAQQENGEIFYKTNNNRILSQTNIKEYNL